LGDTTDRDVFTLVSSLNDKNVTAISASSHSFAIDSDGKVYATGHNSRGALGLGDSGYENNRFSFTPVPSLNDKNVTAVVAGSGYSFTLDNNGKIYATGVNGAGQLGLGDTTDRSVFTPVTVLDE
jgi:alpha-tubulin suppressor-like RCC1 family protein